MTDEPSPEAVDLFLRLYKFAKAEAAARGCEVTDLQIEITPTGFEVVGVDPPMPIN